jgi:UDP-2-acetamido-2-deoxy-ribo-hexuluronate aminotransferase
MKKIQMVDLNGQTEKIKQEILSEIGEVIESSAFINGPQVRKFASSLGDYTKSKHVIPCANGTDALQIAFMALNLEPGDEVIIPAFNYVALAEVASLLYLNPVFVDVHPEYFTIDPQSVREKITENTKVIAPVHLFGQCAPMEEIMDIAKEFNLYVVEDNAQAIGAEYTFSNGVKQQAGTIGDIGTTSFFPSKNLGCFGDGGAIFTQNDELAQQLKVIANHGQRVKYIHDTIGINSRLDTMQAAILNVKLKHLDAYSQARLKVADAYDQGLKELSDYLTTPRRFDKSTHVFHQYTLMLKSIDRDSLRSFLASKEIPTMVYYPISLHQQKAYSTDDKLLVSEALTSKVLSLPISTEMDTEQINYIIQEIKSYCLNQNQSNN